MLRLFVVTARLLMLVSVLLVLGSVADDLGRAGTTGDPAPTPPPPAASPLLTTTTTTPLRITFSLDIHTRAADGVTLKSTKLTLQVLDSSSSPLVSVSADVCKALLAPPAKADVVSRCEKEMLDVLWLRSVGRTDESTVHLLVLSDMPLSYFLEENSRSNEDGMPRFLIVNPASNSTEADVSTAWANSTVEMLDFANAGLIPKNAIRVGLRKEDKVPTDRKVSVADAITALDEVTDRTFATNTELNDDLNDGLIAAQKSSDDASRVIPLNPQSFFKDVDSVAQTLPTVSPYSTLGGFIHPSLYLRGPVLTSPKGRGVWSSNALPAWTMFELSPSLLVPSVAMRISDSREYADAPTHNILLDYLFPAPGELKDKYSLVPLGWGALYNHCDERDANSHWETVRFGVQDATISNRLNSFAIRFFTTKDVKPGEELCWDYGSGYWEPAPLSHRSRRLP